MLDHQRDVSKSAVQLFYETAREWGPAEKASYESLQAEIGLTKRQQQAAKPGVNKLLKAHNKMLVNIPSFGWQILPPTEFRAEGIKHGRKSLRAAGRELEVYQTIPRGYLSRQEQKALDDHAAISARNYQNQQAKLRQQGKVDAAYRRAGMR